jgi:DNA-binding NtrC family response regulator
VGQPYKHVRDAVNTGYSVGGMAVPVLVVDDEPEITNILRHCLSAQGFDAVAASNGMQALEIFRAQPVPVVLLDLRMPGVGGLDVLSDLLRLDRHVSVVILTADMEVATVVEAMRRGAYDYLTKPVQLDEVVLTVRRALERRELLGEVEELRREARAEVPLKRAMGSSAAVAAVVEQVEQVSASDFTVLIQGETGTGKELVARAIHDGAARRDGPFVTVDCGAIPETLIESELFGHERGAFTGADRRKAGHFQLADRGTLFLDEVGNLPLTTQATLLRVLQDRQVRPLGAAQAAPVDVRIIAASNVDLLAAAGRGRFRDDLYYRLSEFTITLPPLRERPEDVPHLVRRCLGEAAMDLRRPVYGISAAAMELLQRHQWPGNVRELRNVVRQAVLRSAGTILPEHLSLPTATRTSPPAFGTAAMSLRELAHLASADVEQRAIREALRSAGGNKRQAAKALRTDYKTLHTKMKEYGISGREFQEP